VPLVAVTVVAGISSGRAATLAHQGGWDEFLFVAAPIAVVVGLLRVAGARSRRIQRERAEDGSGGVSRGE